MNAKQAKRLRKMALALSVNLVQSGKDITLRDTIQDGSSVVNRKDTVRAIYQNIKSTMNRKV